MHCTGHDVILNCYWQVEFIFLYVQGSTSTIITFVNVILLFCSFQILWHVSDVFWTHTEFEIILVSPMLHEKRYLLSIWGAENFN